MICTERGMRNMNATDLFRLACGAATGIEHGSLPIQTKSNHIARFGYFGTDKSVLPRWKKTHPL
jgi:hypothetical protein